MQTDPSKLKGFSKLYVTVAAVFITCLLISNIIAGRLIDVAGYAMTGAVLIFPITYIFGDVLTEVWGFKRSRLIIWLGFGANLLMVAIFMLLSYMPHPAGFDTSPYETVLGFTPIAVMASLLGYFCGEFTNSISLSIIKKKTKGKHLWIRTIGSTVLGEGVDTVIFITIAFGVGMGLPLTVIGQMILLQYVIKTSYEILATPLTYRVVNYIKRKEQTDIYDYGIDYNPFDIKEI